jgi:hypothetical protein
VRARYCLQLDKEYMEKMEESLHPFVSTWVKKMGAFYSVIDDSG